jgi:hypothetical protein
MTAIARPSWRTVAIPAEHGGWGLTLEAGLLGLLVAPSIAGGALAIAAFLAFLVRTPLKLVLVDRRRGRELDRDRLARRVATVELVALVALVILALALAGADWIAPFAVALPLFVVELWFDARSRGRRLVPELCGAVGISAVAASIALAGGEAAALAVALWLVLAARAVASIPFARVQVMRLRAVPPSPQMSDVAQVTGLVIAALAVAVDVAVLAGAIAVAVVVVVQLAWSRGPARPAKVVGFFQLGLGIAVVIATAVGVAA